MRTNLLIDLPVSTDYDLLDSLVHKKIAEVTSGGYSAKGMVGTIPYDGRYIIQVQVNVGHNQRDTCILIGSLFDMFSLDWNIIACQSPRRFLMPESIEEVGSSFKAIAHIKVPANFVNYMPDRKLSMSSDATPPKVGDKLAKNFGDLPWVWEGS